jgi:hypothetical protein
VPQLQQAATQRRFWPSSAQPPEVWKGSLNYSASHPFNALQPAFASPTQPQARARPIWALRSRPGVQPPPPAFLGVRAVHDKPCPLFSCATSNPVCALTPSSLLPWSAAPPPEPGAARVARCGAVPGRCRVKLTPPGASMSRAAPHQPLPAARGALERRHPWRTQVGAAVLRPPSKSGCHSSSMPSVSSSLKFPRPPLPSPQLNRAPGCPSRRRLEPPEPSSVSVQS